MCNKNLTCIEPATLNINESSLQFSFPGYIGHLASRHPENDTIASEPFSMLTEAMEGPSHISIKQEPIDAELAIPRCELTNTNYSGPPISVNPAMPNIVVNPAGVIRTDPKKTIKTTRGEILILILTEISIIINIRRNWSSAYQAPPS